MEEERRGRGVVMIGLEKGKELISKKEPMNSEKDNGTKRSAPFGLTSCCFSSIGSGWKTKANLQAQVFRNRLAQG